MSSTPRSGGSGHQPPLPASIGKYKVLERIGRGAMGVVYSARDEIMDRVVALKVMAGDLEAEPDTRARFYREAKVGGQLLHRNITTVFDLGESEGRLFMVMELLRGLPLNQFLSRPEGVSLEVKLDLMIQLCEGLAAAHAHGVFHRDIKPSNLYVLDDGTLKILDFGIARLATSTMTATGSIVGTPDYMSPEQTIGGEIDQRSDIFSAGALFYAMLSGSKPFASPDLPTVLRKVQREDPPPIVQADVPAGLVHIVMKALAKKKEDRPQNARELAAALVQFRREWEGEARSIAERAHGVYKTIESLLEEQLHAAERLGLEKPHLPDPALASIHEEYPIVADRGPDALLRIPFRRDVITAIAARLDTRRAELEVAVNRLHAASLAANRPLARRLRPCGADRAGAGSSDDGGGGRPAKRGRSDHRSRTTHASAGPGGGAR
jgi:serine/threonine protein kinase